MDLALCNCHRGTEKDKYKLIVNSYRDYLSFAQLYIVYVIRLTLFFFRNMIVVNLMLVG